MANARIPGLPVAITLDGTEQLEVVQPPGDTSGVSKRATSGQIARLAITQQFPAAIEFLIDGGGSVIGVQQWGYMVVPFDCTITSATMLADRTGSIVVDVWKCTYAQFDAGATHPVVGDSICGGFPPTIVNGKKYQDLSIPGWSRSLLTGDVLAFNVPSAASIERITLELALSRILIET